MVELIEVKVKAAYQSTHGTGIKFRADKACLHFRYLRQSPAARVRFHDADDAARFELFIFCCRRKVLGCEFLIGLELYRCPVFKDGGHHVHRGCGSGFLASPGFGGVFHDERTDIGDNRGRQLRHGGQPRKRPFNVLFPRGRIGNIDVSHRAPVAVLAVVGNQVVRNGFPGCGLVGITDGGVDIEPERVGVFLKGVVDQHAREFGCVIGVNGVDGSLVFIGFFVVGDKRCGFLRVVLVFTDVAQVVHAGEYVVFTHHRAFGIDNWVIGRRCHGKPCDRSSFTDREFRELLAEINLGGSGKTVGALSEIDLIEIDLKNLILRQVFLDLIGHCHFVELTGVRSFRRQKEVAGHLHGDGGAALTLAAGDDVGDGCAGDT